MILVRKFLNLCVFLQIFFPFQLVSNSQQSVRRVNLYALAALGYAVVIIDTMGSSHRGIQFEAAIQNKMVLYNLFYGIFNLHPTSILNIMKSRSLSLLEFLNFPLGDIFRFEGNFSCAYDAIYCI